MHPSNKKKVTQLLKELQHLYGERLVSVCIYGSAVFKEDVDRVDDKHRDINALVILQSLSLSDLEKASSISKWWDKTAHALPMFLSEEEWRRSSDVFALEYADIRDNHHVAYGKDLYSDVEIIPDALRLVCELELHRKLIYMRQRLLLHRDKPKVLIEMLQKSVNSYAALFRGVLRLVHKTKDVPQQPDAVFHALKDLVAGYDPAPFLKVLASRQPGHKIAEAEAFSLYNRFIEQVGTVTEYVDQCLGFVNRKEGVCQ